MPIRVTTKAGGQGYIRILAGSQHLIHQLKLDVSRLGKTGTKDELGYLPAGTFLGAKGGPVVSTVLAAAAAATDTFIDVASARGMEAGDVLVVNGTNVTIAANGIAYGTGAGGSDRITLTAAIGAAKANGDSVKGSGNDSAVAVLGPEPVLVGSADHFVNSVHSGGLVRHAIEDNLNRVLTAQEVASLGAQFQLL